MRDCVERNRVPKVHGYGDHVLIVLHAPDTGSAATCTTSSSTRSSAGTTGDRPRAHQPGGRPGGGAARDAGGPCANRGGRFRPKSVFELSHAIVSALTRNQEAYVETMTRDVWQLEQRVTGGDVGEPEGFITDLFRARHGLLAVRTMAALGGAIYGRMSGLTRIPPGGETLVADIIDQFERVRSVADSEKEYLQGVIEFYQTVLTVNAALVGQAQNVEVKRLTEASYSQNEEESEISAWAAIFFAPTLIGTVYGMNFNRMPELHWRFGYPAAVILMMLLSVALYVLFRRRQWL